jgi:hypothetical protein
VKRAAGAVLLLAGIAAAGFGQAALAPAQAAPAVKPAGKPPSAQPSRAAAKPSLREVRRAKSAQAQRRKRPAPVAQHRARDTVPPAPLEHVEGLLPGVIRVGFHRDALVSPRTACLLAARRAEEVHGLPEGLLVAIALSESGLHAHALNIGGRAHYPETLAAARALYASASRGSSVMAGCVQVNARVHARGADWPLDAARSADWGGALLRRMYRDTGSWTVALARWHGGSLASTRRVLCRVRAKLEVTAPGSNVLHDSGCSSDHIARVRRSGVTLLEIAEAR